MEFMSAYVRFYTICRMLSSIRPTKLTCQSFLKQNQKNEFFITTLYHEVVEVLILDYELHSRICHQMPRLPHQLACFYLFYVYSNKQCYKYLIPVATKMN